jgi:hypothetical protein
MAIIHLMVPDFIILGWFATPSQQGNCALTGLSQVVNRLTIFMPSFKSIPSPGYDHIIQGRIYHILDTNSRFRAQIADLLANESTEIEIDEDMAYHSFVTSITSFAS